MSIEHCLAGNVKLEVTGNFVELKVRKYNFNFHQTFTYDCNKN